MKLPIYLDYSATTPVDPRVLDKMLPYLRESFGNPASRSHAFGWEAGRAVEAAREEVAALVNADPREIIWTSGATESINLALKGAAHFYRDKGRHLVTVRTEHKATLDTMRELEREGFEVTYLDVAPDGPDVVVRSVVRAGGMAFVLGEEIVESVADLPSAPLEVAAHAIEEISHAGFQRRAARRVVTRLRFVAAFVRRRRAALRGGRRLRRRLLYLCDLLRPFHKALGTENFSRGSGQIHGGDAAAAIVHKADFPDR